MSITSQKVVKRDRRHARIRAKVKGTDVCPRLAVYRSNRFVYAQLINDDTGTTIVGTDSRKVKGATAVERAASVGQNIAAEAKAKGITKAVFDRGGFSYQGAVVALADGARAGGLQF
jgi:large subunit ribosomal protein L18